MSPELTAKLRRLCIDIAHAYKWYVVESDYKDDAWLMQMLDQYVSVDLLKMRYANDYFEIDEFEQLLDLKLGVSLCP